MKPFLYKISLGFFLLFYSGVSRGFADEASLLGGELQSNEMSVYTTPIELKKTKKPGSTCKEPDDGFQVNGLGIKYVKRNPCLTTP